jgi:hypothetical protein
MNQRNWFSLTLLAVAAVVLCGVLWLVFVDRDEPPGATGSIPGARPLGTPVTPETPGR